MRWKDNAPLHTCVASNFQTRERANNLECQPLPIFVSGRRDGRDWLRETIMVVLRVRSGPVKYKVARFFSYSCVLC